MHDPASRPANRARSLLHVASGLFALAVIVTVPPSWLPWIAGAMFVWAWTMEIGRRNSAAVNRLLMWVFGPVAHPHEARNVNSATWYSTALFGLALVATPLECALAVTVLGFGDPAAGLVGRRFGTIRLAAGRSLEGTLAFVVAGTLAAAAALTVCFPEIATGETWALAFGSAVAGALGELFTRRVDDNLVIPLAAAAGAAAVAAAF
ncbi:MAG: diacylglycerol/polyprenol kinase family protein [Myxococcota bacterium]